MKYYTKQIRNILETNGIDTTNIKIRQGKKWYEYKVIFLADYDCYYEMKDFYIFKDKTVNYDNFRYEGVILERDFYNKIEDAIYFITTESKEIENGSLFDFEYFIKTED